MGLIRMGLIVLAAVLAFTLFKRLIGGRKAVGVNDMEDERLGRLVQDPNCQVYVDSAEAVRRKVPDGQLFFCSEECAEAYFEKARQGE